MASVFCASGKMHFRLAYSMQHHAEMRSPDRVADPLPEALLKGYWVSRNVTCTSMRNNALSPSTCDDGTTVVVKSLGDDDDDHDRAHHILPLFVSPQDAVRMSPVRRALQLQNDMHWPMFKYLGDGA